MILANTAASASLTIQQFNSDAGIEGHSNVNVPNVHLHHRLRPQSAPDPLPSRTAVAFGAAMSVWTTATSLTVSPSSFSSMARTCMLPLKPPLPGTSAVFVNCGSSAGRHQPHWHVSMILTVVPSLITF